MSVHAGAVHTYGWVTTVTHVSRDQATAEAALLADEVKALTARSGEKTDAVGKLRAQVKRKSVAAAPTAAMAATQKESWAKKVAGGARWGGDRGRGARAIKSKDPLNPTSPTKIMEGDRGSTEGRGPPRRTPADSGVKKKHKSNRQPTESRVKEAQQETRFRPQKKAAVPTYKPQKPNGGQRPKRKSPKHPRNP